MFVRLELNKGEDFSYRSLLTKTRIFTSTASSKAKPELSIKVFPEKPAVSFTCTFPSNYIAAEVKLTSKANALGDSMQKRICSREINAFFFGRTLFDRREEELMFYDRSYLLSPSLGGYYKCVLRTAHGNVFSSEKVFWRLEGMFHLLLLAQRSRTNMAS